MSGRALLLAGALGLASSAIVVAQAPESLLPPGFENPPAPATPGATPGPRSGASPAPRDGASRNSQAPRASGNRSSASRAAPSQPRAPRLPPLDLDPELLAELIELQRPKYDIPPGYNRSLATVGVLDESEGGLAQADTGSLNGAYLQRLIAATDGPLVSRWGSILVRRALVSRLATPVGMDGADWAALRAQLLLRMGEAWPARALVQEVDSGEYTPALEDAALASYLGTADILGVCPISAITASKREDAEWQMVRAMCDSFEGDGSRALAELERHRRRGLAKNIDVLLAQKVAGSAFEGRKAVRIEWEEVDELTPWRHGLALATGMEPPEELLAKSGGRFAPITARAPMLPLTSRARAADTAAASGVLSSSAMVDLYSQIFSSGENDEEWNNRAALLRRAYVAANPAARLGAMQDLWKVTGQNEASYGRLVLTAYAAARMPVHEKFVESADNLVASMLAAGLDRNAVRWGRLVPTGSRAWGMLAVAAPSRDTPVSTGALESFRDEDSSPQTLRSRFLVAGLAGLGRVEAANANAFARTVGMNLERQTRWTRAIERAAAQGNQALVVFLAAAGMQGARWENMTGLHLFHIVSALRRVGLEGEARMMAAEALART